MKKYNLIVVGGGLTGVAAAVSAARAGLSVLLAEKSGSLGGAMTNCLVYPFMRYWTMVGDDKKYLSKGLFMEMRNRQQEYFKNSSEYEFSPEHFKYVLDDMVTEENIDVLFHSTLFKVNSTDKKIKTLLFAVKSGVMEIEADFFVDATGDGDLFTFAGCDYQLGRSEDNLCQPMTTCFRVANVDEDIFVKDFKRLQNEYKELKQQGKFINPREDILQFRGLGKGIVHFNTTRVVKHNPTDPFEVSRAEILARKQINEIFTFLQEHSVAFKDSFVVSSAADIGVRESRMLRGEHILTAKELIACTKFPDAIALGNYDIDIHNPEGSGTSHRYFAPGEYYTIPYRSLVTKEFDNLLVGGRCISATHEAQASIRIMPICATTGEAAGTAIGVAYNSDTNTHSVNVAHIQKKLRENGAAID